MGKDSQNNSRNTATCSRIVKDYTYGCCCMGKDSQNNSRNTVIRIVKDYTWMLCRPNGWQKDWHYCLSKEMIFRRLEELDTLL
jgi:hypothetical protein